MTSQSPASAAGISRNVLRTRWAGPKMFDIERRLLAGGADVEVGLKPLAQQPGAPALIAVALASRPRRLLQRGQAGKGGALEVVDGFESGRREVGHPVLADRQAERCRHDRVEFGGPPDESIGDVTHGAVSLIAGPAGAAGGVMPDILPGAVTVMVSG